ncbi:hypothetical protein ASZ78_007728 [Callipepla squamata]|uniref:MHD domain-containing protein n=1 Tax=Callipepla squamata TaxID=9009 RepID=A0A226MB88_CALSU|nr:hypothetical protein ASZ78_007728 [Callipepla squamata]
MKDPCPLPAQPGICMVDPEALPKKEPLPGKAKRTPSRVGTAPAAPKPDAPKAASLAPKGKAPTGDKARLPPGDKKGPPSGTGTMRSAGARAAMGAGRASPAGSRAAAPPGPPVYVDLAYLPGSWSARTVDEEFFRRVRSLCYVCKEEAAGTLEAVQLLQGVAQLLAKCKESYHSKCHEHERLRREGTSQKDIDKAELKSQKAAEALRRAVDKYNAARNDFEQRMVESATRFQEVEEAHLRHMKGLIGSYSHSVEDTHVQIGQVHEEFKQNVENIGTETLLRRFAESKGTGRERPGLSRGPSPVVLGSQDALPVATAFTEYVHAYFKGHDADSCLVKVTGELTMSFPAGIVRVFSGTMAPPVLSFRLLNAGAIEQFLPNAELLYSVPPPPPRDPPPRDPSTRDFWLNMAALTGQLQKQAEQSPSASYYNVALLKYQFSRLGPSSAPLRLCVRWDCAPGATRVSVEYGYNAGALALPVPLANVHVLLPLDEPVTNVRLQPKASW